MNTTRKIINIKHTRNEEIDLNEFDINLDKYSIARVWTIYDKDVMWNHCKFNPHTGKPIVYGNLDSLYLEHRQGVFLEETLHDWSVYNNKFKYYSRVSRIGERVDILLELKEKN